MSHELIILCCISGIILFIVALICFIGYWEGREEKRLLKKSVASFKHVAESINSCRYWLNSEQHKPYREFFVYLVYKMGNYQHLSGSEVREKVNEIIKSNEPKLAEKL